MMVLYKCASLFLFMFCCDSRIAWILSEAALSDHEYILMIFMRILYYKKVLYTRD